METILPVQTDAAKMVSKSTIPTVADWMLVRGPLAMLTGRISSAQTHSTFAANIAREGAAWHAR